MGAEGVSEFALFFDGGEDALFSVAKFGEVGGEFFDGAELGVVEAAGGFFAVAGDEGDGVSVTKEAKGCGDAGFGYV